MPIVTAITLTFGVGVVSNALLSWAKDGSRKAERIRRGLAATAKQQHAAPGKGGAVAPQRPQQAGEGVAPTPDSAETVLARALPAAGLGVASAIAAFANPVFALPAALITGYLTVPLFRDGVRKFRKHRHAVDLLDSAIVPLLIAIHQVLAATFLILSISASRRLLARTYDRSRQSLRGVLNALPKCVWIYKDGVEVEVDYREVQSGDVVVAGAGELVPVDGTVIRGEGLIDQKMLTGESIPAEKKVGDRVFASTSVASGRLFICVELAGEQTHAGEVSALILKAADRRMAVQERGEVIAEKSLPPLLGLSTIAAYFGGLSRALGVYLVTPGYTMRLLAPLALLRTLRHSADAGILVKDGRSLELLRDINTIVFDKTGTLTDGSLKVAEVIPSASFDSHAVLAAAAGAESCQTHPIARAIVAAAQAAGIAAKPLDETEYTVGRGVRAWVGGREVLVGSLAFLAGEGYELPQALSEKIEASAEEGFTLIFVAIGSAIAGCIALDQVIRPSARQAIAEMRRRGMETVIISGDARAATKHLAAQLGIDNFHAEVLPGGKAAIIDKMQSQGRRVCYVGDGINDAAALKQANVSMSIRGSSTIAVDTAQIVLVSADLALIDNLFDISERYESVTGFAARLAVGLPLLTLPVVFFGFGGTVLVIAAHNVSTWVGLWRILNTHRQSDE